MPDTRLVIRAFGFLSILLLAFLWSPVGFTQDGESASTSPFAGLRFREIGPASPAGRIDDFAVWKATRRFSTSRRLVEDRQSRHYLSAVGFLRSLRQADACHGQSTAR